MLPPSTAALSMLARCIRQPQVAQSECRHVLREATKASCRRPFSGTSRQRDEDVALQISNSPSNQPRYAQTPERMKAPFSIRRKRPENQWEVNEDPKKLNQFYRTMLGDSGDKLLTDEVKWLAVTHKSFDQGRRGYNDRLAFLGKQIITLQASLALLNRTDGSFHAAPDPYEEQREPFRHPGVDLLPRLTEQARAEAIDQSRMAKLANEYGLPSVLRWKPKITRDLAKSGSETVLAQALYAVIGAVALQRGGEVAVRLVKERILNKLGLPKY